MPPLKIHLDTDFGGDIDDLCALALLLGWPDVEITGITTVAEHAGKRAGFVRYVLWLAGEDGVPVAAGADARSGRYRQPPGLPSEEHYWPEAVAAAPGPEEAAIDLLKHSLDLGATLIAIGPFTNLALLEARHPGTLNQAKLCLMGGSVRAAPDGFPAWGSDMDYNVQADPIAATQVLESSHPTLVPIEATVQTALRRSHLPALERSAPLGPLIAHQAKAFDADERNSERYRQTCSKLPDDIVNFQHDPLACSVALGWDGVTLETVALVLDLGEDGLLRMRADPHGHAYLVASGVDGERFNQLWLDVVTNSRRWSEIASVRGTSDDSGFIHR